MIAQDDHRRGARDGIGNEPIAATGRRLDVARLTRIVAECDAQLANARVGRTSSAAADGTLPAGARLDLFCATTLGKNEIVKACIADTPSIINVKGPHGISLLRHAKAGKQDALAELLTAAGAS